MSFGPPPFISGLHPPPSFWSTSAAKQATSVAFAAKEKVLSDSRAPFEARSDGTGRLSPTVWHRLASTPCGVCRRETGNRNRTEVGTPSAATSTGCSPQKSKEGGRVSRRRKKTMTKAAAATATTADGEAGADGFAGGCPGRPQPQSSVDDALVASPSADEAGERRDDVSEARGNLERSSPEVAAPSPPKELWGDDGSPMPQKSPSPASSRVQRRRRNPASACSLPTRLLAWSPFSGESAEHEEQGAEWGMGETSPAGCNRQQVGGRMDNGLGGDFIPRRSPVSSVSPRRSAAVSSGGEGRGGTEAASAFLEEQRALLKQLEALYVSVADDRRNGLVALRREENEWKASAMQRARREVTGATDSAGPSGGLEERARERIIEEGPGPEEMRAVGLVEVSDRGDGDGDANAFCSTREGRGYGVGRWRLATEVVEEMRREFELKIDEDTAQVLEQENKALLEARAELSTREGARTKRELRVLGGRLTQDGRDALAALQWKLEAREEEQLSEEREKLKEALACALEEERERLLGERQEKVLDAQEKSRWRFSQLAANLWEQAERSTLMRKEEAVRLLDEAAARARAQLDALLQAQEERALEEVRDRGARERKAAVKLAREKGERRCLKEIEHLTEGARNKNELWIRTVLCDIRRLTHVHGEDEGEGRRADQVAAAGAGAGTLRLRAVEAAEDCGRLGRRLVELVAREARMNLRETDFDGDSKEFHPREPEVTAAAADTRADGTGADIDKKGESGVQGNTGNTGRHQTCCQDCERLARANVELSRLLFKTPPRPTSPKPARLARTPGAELARKVSRRGKMNNEQVATRKKTSPTC